MVLFGEGQTALAAPSVPPLLFPPTPWSISETSPRLATAFPTVSESSVRVRPAPCRSILLRSTSP